MGVFTFQGNKYPTNEYFIQVRGDNVGIKSIYNNDWIITPQPFDTYWGEASVQDTINTIGADLFSVGASFDPDAQLVIDRMTSLSSTEETAINNFVIAEKSDGNYVLYDEFFCQSLGATNGLVGFKSKTANPVGGVTWSVDGATFNGTTGYIDTNFNPSVDSVNYQFNDATIGSFVKENLLTTTLIGNVIGFSDGTQVADMLITGSTGLLQRLRINTAPTRFENGATHVTSNTMLTHSRTTSTLTTGYNDGVSVLTSVWASFGILPTNSFKVGSTRGTGSFFNGTVSTSVIGAGIGFNHAAHNTNVRVLLTELGVAL